MNFIRFTEQLFFPTNATCNYCGKESVYKYGLCKDCYLLLEKPAGERCNICMERIYTEGLCSACFDKRPDYTKLF